MNGAVPHKDFVRGQNRLIGKNHVAKKRFFEAADLSGSTAVGMQKGKNLLTKPVDTSAVAKQNGDLPKFSSTKEDAPGYVPPKDSGELKNVSELPGYQPIIGSSVNAPGRRAIGGLIKASGIAAAAYTFGTFAYEAVKNKIRNKKK